ncbi:glycosyltransferase 87 family protein [Agrilactobacillus fermenti]|uniref:glycosyltransferase 87 family protein n=1 Tax=Agrilactobacillus fermenti TaxID=2586909 RepID=UPI003A5C2AE4
MKLTATWSKKQICIVFYSILFSLLLTFLMISGFFQTKVDLQWTNFQWVHRVGTNLWGMYAPHFHVGKRIDYPPLYPILLSTLQGWLRPGLVWYTSSNAWFVFLAYVSIRFWPIVFQIANGWLIFRFCGQNLRAAALGLALVLLPALTFNTIIWGQIDSALIFFTLAAALLLKHDKVRFSAILLGLGCLMKFQVLYFVPLFIAETWLKHGWRRTLDGVFYGFLTIYVGWFPFSLYNFDFLLPFTMTFKAFGEYSHLLMGGFNVWGASFYGRQPNIQMNQTFFGTFTYNQANLLLIALILFFLGVAYWLRQQKLMTFDMWSAGLIYTLAIFMLTGAQHERYQLIMMPFLFLLLLTKSTTHWVGDWVRWQCFGLLILFNEFTVWIQLEYHVFGSAKQAAQFYQWGSLINVSLSLILLLWFLWAHYRQHVLIANSESTAGQLKRMVTRLKMWWVRKNKG